MKNVNITKIEGRVLTYYKATPASGYCFKSKGTESDGYLSNVISAYEITNDWISQNYEVVEGDALTLNEEVKQKNLANIGKQGGDYVSEE